MTSHLLNKIQKCANSHRGISNPQPCGSDWCNTCDIHQTRTDKIVDAALNKFGKSNAKLYHVTADIGPVQSPTQAIELTKQILHKIAKLDVELIGSLEFANPKFTPGFSGNNNHKPFFKTLHFGNAHLHYITNQYQKTDDELIRSKLFNNDRQLYQQLQGIGKYEDQSTEAFITRVINYGRKRSRIQTKEWFKAIKDSDQQLSFMVSYGEVFVWEYDGNEWKEEVNNLNVSMEKEWSKGWRKGSKTLTNLEKSERRIGPVVYNGRSLENEEKSTNSGDRTDKENQKEFSNTVYQDREETITETSKQLPHEVNLTAIKFDLIDQPRTDIRQAKRLEKENLSLLKRVRRRYYSQR